MSPRKRDFLYTPEGREWLLVEYVEKERSTYDISEQLGPPYYPNKVNRALRFHRFQLRDHRKAQKVALKTGRHTHPTKGKKHSAETRAKISNAIKRNPDDAKS